MWLSITHAPGISSVKWYLLQTSVRLCHATRQVALPGHSIRLFHLHAFVRCLAALLVEIVVVELLDTAVLDVEVVLIVELLALGGGRLGRDGRSVGRGAEPGFTAEKRVARLALAGDDGGLAVNVVGDEEAAQVGFAAAELGVGAADGR